MPEQGHTTPHNLVTEDLGLIGRIAAIGAAFGSLGIVSLWAVEPARVGSPGLAAAEIAAWAALSLAALFAPWERLTRRYIMLPVTVGVGLTAVTCWNTDGAQSPFAFFYLYLAAMAAYFATRRQTLFSAAVVSVAAYLPVIYDRDVGMVDRVFEWTLITAMATALSLLLQYQQDRVRRAAEHAEALAVQDPLTGIPNRRGFEQRAAAELARARRHNLTFSVLYLDLDGFKTVNDVAGHAAGDDLLRRVALAIAVAVRGEDFVARFGGDEFAVLLPAAAGADARRVAARIVGAVERTADDDERLSGLSASFGLASYPADGVSLAELLEVADVGLLRVKRERARDRGRDTHAFRVPDAPAVADDLLAELGAPEDRGADAPWRLGSALRRGALGAALVLAAWFGGPLVLGGEPIRTVAHFAALLAVVAAAVLAARRTGGRERLAWAVLAGAAPLSVVPLLGSLGGVAVGGAVLALGALPPTRDRGALLEAANVLLLLSAAAVGLLLPVVLHRHDLPGLELASTIAALLAITLGVTCALLVGFRTRFRTRPDLWLLGAGLAVASFSGLAYLLTAARFEPAPDAWWQVVFPLAAVAVATGAQLRATNPGRVLVAEADPARRPPDTLLTSGLIVAVLVCFVLAHGAMPAVAVGIFVLVVVLRSLKAHLLERENSELVELAHESEREVSALYRASLVALGTALEARDGYTGNHGEETVVLARRVAERMGLSAPAIAQVETVALLHDVGKIGMPDEILRKEGRLDEDEWAIMREHPVIGERILRSVPGLDDVARGVRHEHERWDGGGYPDGLAGEEIPLASRITLVCDAYHAMTSDRSYRKALARGHAMAELRNGAGAQFDPAVVRALLAALAEDERGLLPEASPARPADAPPPQPAESALRR